MPAIRSQCPSKIIQSSQNLHFRTLIENCTWNKTHIYPFTDCIVKTYYAKLPNGYSRNRLSPPNSHCSPNQ